MSEETALRAIDTINRDKWEADRCAAQVLNIIGDYIPRACQREAHERLFDAFFINGVELTTNQMRKEYEEWKKLHLDMMMFQPTVIWPQG